MIPYLLLPFIVPTLLVRPLLGGYEGFGQFSQQVALHLVPVWVVSRVLVALMGVATVGWPMPLAGGCLVERRAVGRGAAGHQFLARQPVALRATECRRRWRFHSSCSRRLGLPRSVAALVPSRRPFCWSGVRRELYHRCRIGSVVFGPYLAAVVTGADVAGSLAVGCGGLFAGSGALRALHPQNFRTPLAGFHRDGSQVVSWFGRGIWLPPAQFVELDPVVLVRRASGYSSCSCAGGGARWYGGGHSHGLSPCCTSSFSEVATF